VTRVWVSFLLAAFAASPVLAREIAPAAMDALPSADVIFLGEIHDNAAHHENQARAVRAIAPRAIVFEMLTPDQAARVPQDRSDAAAMDAAIGWTARGWPDFRLYQPIFAAAPDARIYGADVSEDEVRRALVEGAGPVFGVDAARFGLNTPLSADEAAARQAEQAEAHCGAMPSDALPGMVEVQRLRDATLARAAIAAVADTGGPVVVITGTGHARRDWGAPAVLVPAAPVLTVLSVGQIEADASGVAEDAPPFDLWVVTPPQPGRGDPCAVFRGTE
jgi:uncharacterized iron-regulated protein